MRNTSAGVDIEVDGTQDSLDLFARKIAKESPPLARIDEIFVTSIEPDGFSQFEIIHSEPIAGAFQPISPDVCVCADCLRELYDPADRRYRYPFINCTNCGPRFTIIEDIPYDRPFTTMSPFEMCSLCAAEYQDPSDRRFHAQPVACPDCGPQVWLEIIPERTVAGQPDPASGRRFSTPGRRRLRGHEAMQEARALLANGQVIAAKGLGGFHLACDATDRESVNRLRERKLRVDKPFAVMILDLDTIRKHCLVSDSEESLLKSRERPVVILKRRSESSIVSGVAPGQDTVGVMLPYTPLHYLLLEKDFNSPDALVMTSGNLSEEPIATKNEEARRRLSRLADAFLFHDRDIRTRCDDSVVRVFERDERHHKTARIQPTTGIENQADKNRGLAIRDQSPGPGPQSLFYPLRRSRGYAPYPVKVPWNSPPLLATGAELKNAFCLAKGRHAFMSHHIGDLENYETLMAFEDGINHLERLFRVKPEALAFDLHPDYLASRYAQARAADENIPLVGVQHHHAHIAACMAEHQLAADQPVIGISFDGTGYGDDGAIWGGEILIANYNDYQRVFHLEYVPLPGGDKAIREPWRMALAWLDKAGVDWTEDLHPVAFMSESEKRNVALDALHHQLRTGLNAPPTSSMGRLFDAVSSIAGVRQRVNYEAQAAVEFEALVDPSIYERYPLELSGDIIHPEPMIEALISDLRGNVPISTIASRFHNGVAEMVGRACVYLRGLHQIPGVVLSGGVWQNMTLLRKTVSLLEAEGFTCYLHEDVPANDGGLALGQAAIAHHRLADSASGR